MKYIYLVFAFFVCTFLKAQIVNIPDANFKNALVNTNCVVTFINGSVPTQDADTNNDGEIQVSEAEAIQVLFVTGDGISDLTGIEAFVNLVRLSCYENNLTTADFSANTALITLNISDNNLSNINIMQNSNLQRFICNNNNLTSISFPSNNALTLISCFNNQLSTVDTSESPNLFSLSCSSNNITSLNIQANTQLYELDCLNNQLTELDLTNNPELNSLNCYNNQLTTLDLSQNNQLYSLNCPSNQLTSLLTNSDQLDNIYCDSNLLTELDLSGNTNLRHLNANNNQLTSLDIYANSVLTTLDLNHNNLETLFLKNGSCLLYLGFDNNPNIRYICVDETYTPGCSEPYQVSTILTYNGIFDCVVNSYCNFEPGGTYYEVVGETRFDIDGNGCDNNDTFYANLKFELSNSFSYGYFFGNSLGQHFIPLEAGQQTIVPILENLEYFQVVPSSITLNFPTSTSPHEQDFCITANGVHNDLEIVVLPIDDARPGFDTQYQILYKNKGNTTISGTIDLNFNDDWMDLASAIPIMDSQTEHIISWNFSNLQPFETRTIDVTMTLNTPTDANFPVNEGDTLVYEASINPSTDDETPNDNVFTFNQNVVNSMDPNDKACLEGNTITPETVGAYVHYIIRFENLGSADAVNVVVKDAIDTNKFDVSTLIPLAAGHEYVTRIVQNTHEVEFIFENINLPFDDANNDGYVVFKIKTLPTLGLGDTFANDAEIYFDYNAPITTNDFLTTVEESLSVGEAHSNSFKFYPNPVKDELFVESEFGIHSATVYDVNGRLFHSIAFTDHALKQGIDVSKLSKGIYFVSIVSDRGEVVGKIVKE